MGSQPRERKFGTVSWRLENVRMALGFFNQGGFQEWLGKGFAGSGYGDFLKVGEKSELTEREERKMMRRLGNLDEKLPCNLGEYVRDGGDMAVPPLPEDFDVDAFQKKAEDEVRAQEAQEEMGEVFNEITSVDEYRNAGSGEHVNVLRMLHDAVRLFRCSMQDAERYVASTLVGLGRKDVADILLDRSRWRSQDVACSAMEDGSAMDYIRKAQGKELKGKERKAIGSGQDEKEPGQDGQA